MSGYRIVTVERQHTAVVRATVPFAELQTAEISARTKLANALPTLGSGPTGRSFTLCRRPKDGRMSIEPGVIVACAFDSGGDVVCSQLPAGRAVMHVLVGPFEQLPQAWPALFAWCASEGLEREGTFWQVYGPSTADPARQETTLYALLA
jgi:effector-binding domain-containing protein